MIVVHGVLFAFRSAGFADLGAQGAHLLNKLRAPRLQPRAQGAEVCTIAAEQRASAHFYTFVDIVGSTVFTSGQARQTGVDTFLILMVHDQVVLDEKSIWGIM